MTFFHPKYIPSAWTRGVSRTEPAPVPFNRLYNGKAKFDDNSNEKIWRCVALVAFGLLFWNYYRMVKQQDRAEMLLPPIVEKKRRNDIWISDTGYSKKVVVSSDDFWISPALAIYQSPKKDVPKDYNIIYTSSSPPPMAELPPVLEPKIYIVSKGITVKESELKYSLSTPNVVFAGSFDTRHNAEEVLEKLKKIGYQKAEIIMKERLPHLIVVAGFDYQKQAAKATVKALEKQGIDVYAAEIDWEEIFRAKR